MKGLRVLKVVFLAMLLGATFMKSISAQTAATQIHISGADAQGNFGLAEPVELATITNVPQPAIIVVGADGIGRFDLTEMEERSVSASSAADSEAGDVVLPSRIAVQVTSADAIGRFELQAIESATADQQQGASSAKTGTSLSEPRIQVVGADAIGRFELSPVDSPESAGRTTDSTPAPKATSPSSSATGKKAQVATDGLLNLRNGPGQLFDVIGQLESGAEVDVLAESADKRWLLVMTDEGLTGWVAARSMILE